MAIRTSAIHKCMDSLGMDSPAYNAMTLIPGMILIANPSANGTGATIPIVITVPFVTALLTRAAIPNMFRMVDHPAMRAFASHPDMPLAPRLAT